MTESVHLSSYLLRASQTILPSHNGATKLNKPPQGPLYAGVDLGTANLVMVVLDANK